MDAILDYLNFLRPGLKDVLEIALVTYLIYRILLLWTGTRAFQILFGLVLLVTGYAAASFLDLQLITYILSQVFTYGAFALIVVFQPELRNALAQLGQSRLWRMFSDMEESEVAEVIARATERLQRAKIGGIIAVEREVGLGEYIESGTEIHADVSAELLTTIFTPYSPLHDGAVIVQGDQLAAAGCILPLTQFPVADKSLGTRHRAGLGLSEETDAVVVIISEETSQISVAHRGHLRRDVSPEELREALAAGTGETIGSALGKDASSAAAAAGEGREGAVGAQDAG